MIPTPAYCRRSARCLMNGSARANLNLPRVLDTRLATSCWLVWLATLRTFVRIKTAGLQPTPLCALRKEGLPSRHLKSKDELGLRRDEMSNAGSNFVRVAEITEVPEGTPKAVKVDGRSIALFQHKGDIYATDNQCPHMGYPLTRGRVRNGVLTCDWHGWSYDMKGGGCFTGGCDD